MAVERLAAGFSFVHYGVQNSDGSFTLLGELFGGNSEHSGPLWLFPAHPKPIEFTSKPSNAPSLGGQHSAITGREPALSLNHGKAND